ncbi:MAG: T9SS type A sorting domain-containing protein [Bacteroidia bacterium]|nr:T9SS type A sorting domain-containing protein [Bacteroidia bacterium]
MKRFYAFISVLLPFWSMAQSGTVTSGGNATGTGGNISFSVGQAVTAPISGTNGKITQGLQQPYEIFVLTGMKETSFQLQASVYPNPATGFVTLSVDQKVSVQFSYVLTDMQGKTISTQPIKNAVTTIDFSQLAKGAYLIQVLQSNQIVKTFNVIKN